MTARIVVITGASSGIGRATARAFARRGRGCLLALIARDRARLEETRAEVERVGAVALTFVADVADFDQVERVAEEIEQIAGPIDVWINNAVATVFGPIQHITPDEFRRVTEVTYLGAVHGTMCALRRMRERDAGTIIQVGSALAYRAIPLQAAYCGAKHAIRGFTDSIRAELIHDRSAVRVTMVQLPGVNTPQFEWCRTKICRHPQPVGTVYQPEVAARAIVWAASHKRREIYVGLLSFVTIILSKWLPAPMDRLMARRAYEQQFTADPVAPDRPDNLYQPAPSRYRVHGAFEAHARGTSAQLWTSLHRKLVGALLGLAGASALAYYLSG